MFTVGMVVPILRKKATKRGVWGEADEKRDGS